MRIQHALLLSGVIVVHTDGLAAQGTSPSPTALVAHTKAKLYSHLFTYTAEAQRVPRVPGTPQGQSPLDAPSASLTPRVVCGMVVIPVDPRVDPGMRRSFPRNEVTHTMRIIVPPICQPERK